jgi:hypothetical protein
VAEIGKRLGLKTTLTTAYSDAVFAQLLLYETPRNHYASSEERKYFSLYRIRSGLIAASVMLLVASMAWSGFNFLDGLSLKQQAVDAQQKANFYQERYAMARRDLPPTPVEPLDIQNAVDIVATLRHYKSGPVPMLEVIGEALETAPSVRLDRIEWHAAVDPNSTGERNNRQREVADTKLIERDPRYSHYHIAVFRGHLPAFAGDFRAAIAEADGIAARLAEHPHVRRAEVVEYPLDVTPGANLAGSASNEGSEDEARFAVKIVLGVIDDRKQS